MTNLLLSLIGLLLADRMLYRLEMFSHLSSRNRMIFMFTIVGIYLFVSIIKDLWMLNYVLFGIFFLFLMFFYLFHEKKLKNLFEGRQKSVVDELILHIKSGKSPMLAYELILNSMSTTEKRIFGCLNSLKSNDRRTPSAILGASYFFELNRILSQRAKVTEQLEMFRTSLNIQIKMRRKSGTVSKSIHAQALVALGIYVLFVMTSWNQFGLSQFPNVLVISIVVFCFGEFLVFTLGRSIKWTA